MELTRGQRARFVRDGYLALDGRIDGDIVEPARNVTQRAMANGDHDTTYQGDRYEHVTGFEDTTPFSRLKHELYADATDLVGDPLERPPDEVSIPEDLQVKVKHPESVRLGGVAPRRARDGHVDGYGYLFREPSLETAGEYTYTTIGVVTYLNDVNPGGGGFTVYPGTHWVAQAYYRNHSLESPGHTGTLPAIDDDGGWDYGRALRDQVRSREVTGPAGTVVLFHNKLVHGVGVNQRDQPRIAAITRFTHEQGEKRNREAARDIWQLWPGLDDVCTDPETTCVLEGLE